MYEVASIKTTINEINRDLCNVIHSLSTQECQPQERILRSIDAQLLTILSKSIQYVKTMKHVKKLDSEMIASLLAQYKNCNIQINEISKEILIKEKSFLENIEKIKENFQQKYEKIVQEFKRLKNEEILKHHEIMKLTQEEINRLNSTFEVTLSERINKCLAEKDQFQSEFELVNKKYLEMKNRFENELKEAEETESRMNSKLKELELDHKNNLLKLEKENQAALNEKESDFRTSYDSLLKKTENLKSKMNSFDLLHNNDLILLKEKVETLNLKKKSEIEKYLSTKQAELSLSEKNIMEKNATEEFKLKESMIKLKSENQIKIENIKQKLAETKEQVAAINSINAEKLKVVNTKAQKEVAELNSTRNKLIYDQKQIIELTKKKYLNDFKQQQKRGEAGMMQSKQRLQQLQADFENQKKRLEGEIIVLIKKRNRLQLDLQNLNASGGINQSSVGFEFFSSEPTEVLPGTESAGDEKITTINQMINKFQTYDKTVKDQMVEIKSMAVKNETEIKSEKQKLISTLERTKKQLNTVADEVRLLKIRQKELINKQTMQEAIKNAELIKNENELKLKIQNQMEMIRQLKEELQKIRTDDKKKPELIQIQADHRKEMKIMHDQIDHFNNDCKNQIEMKVKEMDDKVLQEKERSTDIVMKMLDRIKEALNQLSEAKRAYEDASLQDQQRWMKLRKEIIDTNMTILGRDYSQNECKKSFSSLSKSMARPSSSSNSLQPNSSLPKLNP